MRYAGLPLLVLTAACGGSSSTAPTVANTPPPQIDYTLSGVLRSTNGDQPLVGATIEAAGQTATTNGGGQFLFRVPLGSGTPTFTISGAGLVTRTGRFGQPGISRSLDLDAFGPGFDQDYFRRLAHNSYDSPGTLAAISHWNANPNIYLQTVDDAGTPIDVKTLDMTEVTIRAIVPTWTAGRLSVGVFERGTDVRAVQTGWLNVAWLSTPDNACGTSPVGAWFGGTIKLHYRSGRCQCGGYQMQPATVRHEVGHAMGMWHTGLAADLMSGLGSTCEKDLSAKEREYADYLYRRSNGNVAPDTDAVTVVTARSLIAID
jgi:hypothetical protein